MPAVQGEIIQPLPRGNRCMKDFHSKSKEFEAFTVLDSGSGSHFKLANVAAQRSETEQT